MAKQSGLGDNLYVDGIDLSGDIGSLGSIAGGPAPLELTAIDKAAFERKGGVRSGQLEFVSFWDPAFSHQALRGLPTSDRIVSYYRGTAVGGHAANLIGKQINYDPNRGNDGSLTLAIQALSNGYGLEWGRSLTGGMDNGTSGVPGTAVDFTAATSFGLQAYLHVQAFTGTYATVSVEDSADGSTGWAAVATFAAASAIGAQRIETARNATIRRFLRFNLTGTFSLLNFAVAVAKNDSSVVF